MTYLLRNKGLLDLGIDFLDFINKLFLLSFISLIDETMKQLGDSTLSLQGQWTLIKISFKEISKKNQRIDNMNDKKQEWISEKLK